jgi:small subunit ribosomal protein S8
MTTDPIADMLTRVRNAMKAKHEKVDMPSSRMKKEIARILKEEGFVKNYKAITDKRKEILTVFLKYDSHDEPVIQGLRKISRPGRRVYVKHEQVPRTRSGMGIAIISTSKGIMTDREARKQKLGGELICSIW